VGLGVGVFVGRGVVVAVGGIGVEVTSGTTLVLVGVGGCGVEVGVGGRGVGVSGCGVSVGIGGVSAGVGTMVGVAVGNGSAGRGRAPTTTAVVRTSAPEKKRRPHRQPISKAKASARAVRNNRKMRDILPCLQSQVKLSREIVAQTVIGEKDPSETTADGEGQTPGACFV
jgi:hypothetical protein